jgi:hypothetical protein
MINAVVHIVLQMRRWCTGDMMLGLTNDDHASRLQQYTR